MVGAKQQGRGGKAKGKDTTSRIMTAQNLQKNPPVWRYDDGKSVDDDIGALALGVRPPGKIVLYSYPVRVLSKRL